MDSNWGEGQGRPWYSKDGRYICGIDVGKGPLAWVIDTSNGHVVVQRCVKASNDDQATWRDGSFFIYAYGEKRPLAVLKAAQTESSMLPQWLAQITR
jgi:hypothetical protein